MLEGRVRPRTRGSLEAPASSSSDVSSSFFRILGLRDGLWLRQLATDDARDVGDRFGNVIFEARPNSVPAPWPRQQSY